MKTSPISENDKYAAQIKTYETAIAAIKKELKEIQAFLDDKNRGSVEQRRAYYFLRRSRRKEMKKYIMYLDLLRK